MWSNCTLLKHRTFIEIVWFLPLQNGQPGWWVTTTVVSAHSVCWTQTVLPSRELLASFLKDLLRLAKHEELSNRKWSTHILKRDDRSLKMRQAVPESPKPQPYLEWNVISKLYLKRKSSLSIRQWFICIQENNAKSPSLVSSSQL